MNSKQDLPVNPGKKANEYSPCSLKLLTPSLSSFGEEREKAVAMFAVLERNT
jgi:hypothetical protein